MSIAASQVFQTIYRERQWGRGSGPGSAPSNTIEYRAFVERFIEANGIKTVTDLGCGDWQFSYLIDWSRIEYLGLDVVPEVIAENSRRFSVPNIRFEEFNNINALSVGDLLIAKEVLQHLPTQLIIEYLSVIRQKYRFALLTNSTEPKALANRDIAIGGFRPLRLQDVPFNVPGAVVFNYFVHAETFTFKNSVFLMLGDPLQQPHRGVSRPNRP
jgi:SAM-dependent methyltransferase